MAECVWLKQVLVGQFQFLEWTGDDLTAFEVHRTTRVQEREAGPGVRCTDSPTSRWVEERSTSNVLA